MFRSIVPETGGVDNILPQEMYSSHLRKYTANNLPSTFILDQSNNQYLYTSRDDTGMLDPFSSFKGSENYKSFITKPKSSVSKNKSKKRSRNKTSNVGLTSCQNRYSSKVLKNSTQESTFACLT